MTITQELVTKINSLLDHGLVRGLGQPVPGQMCVEAAICFALDLPHNDKPTCVGEKVRNSKIELNDCNWSSNKARAEGMRLLAIAQLGSDQIDQEAFTQHLKLLSTKRILPYLIQKHYERTKDETLRVYKTKFEQLEALDTVLCQEFYNYSYYYRCYYNYNYNYNYYYHRYNFGDEFLLLIANTILQTLKDLKSPGCEWLLPKT